jgi:hypothetical protein
MINKIDYFKRLGVTKLSGVQVVRSLYFITEAWVVRGGFLLDKVALGQVSEYLGVPTVNPLSMYSMYIQPSFGGRIKDPVEATIQQRAPTAPPPNKLN